MIVRQRYLDRVKRPLGRNPVVALLGPSQCGKTTLARQMISARHPQYFDLEDPVVGRLMENPMTALQGLRGLVVIDEAQRQPGRFPVLRIKNLAGLSRTLVFTNLVSPDTNNFWRIRSLP